MLLLPLLGFLFVSLLVTAAAMALSPASGGTIEFPQTAFNCSDGGG